MPKISKKTRMIAIKKEEKYYRMYRIHLRNGEFLETGEVKKGNL